VEGFTTPWSNKRTASLPNPRPVGPQSCARPQLCARPTHGGIPISQPCWPPAHRPTQHQNSGPSVMPPDPRPLGSPPPLCTRPQPGTGPTADWPAPPPEPTTLQALLSLSHAWDKWNPTPPIRPCLSPAPCGTSGVLPHWDRHHAGVKQPHSPACWTPHPLGRAGPSSTRLPRLTAPPGSCSATTRGLLECLRDTHRLEWIWKN
jgi:hypothetical protein